ncbi:Transposon TX1 uncharacterized 149 kDa protein [Linum perenne]
MSMPNDKAPGSDGYSVSFFKECWNTVGDDVVAAVLHFFTSGKLPCFVNSVILDFIPTKKNDIEVKDFRPIPCCNVVYKLISKLLANRMSEVLPIINQ